MTYSKFLSLSLKARIMMTQKRLLELGYQGFEANGKRNRPTVRAIMDFQVKHGITPNGVICERTFNHLNIQD